MRLINMFIKKFEDFLAERMLHELSGIILILNGKILLVNPKKFAGIPNKWSIPKGHVEKNMSALQSALKELEEEANIQLPKSKVETAREGTITYSKKSADKELTYYVIEIQKSDLSIKLYNDMILGYFLNNDEIGEAGFFNKHDARELIEPQQRILLNFLG